MPLSMLVRMRNPLGHVLPLGLPTVTEDENGLCVGAKTRPDFARMSLGPLWPARRSGRTVQTSVPGLARRVG